MQHCLWSTRLGIVFTVIDSTQTCDSAHSCSTIFPGKSPEGPSWMPLREMHNLVQGHMRARRPWEPQRKHSGFLCWSPLCYLEAVQYLHGEVSFLLPPVVREVLEPPRLPGITSVILERPTLAGHLIVAWRCCPAVCAGRGSPAGRPWGVAPGATAWRPVLPGQECRPLEGKLCLPTHSGRRWR